MSSRKVMVVTGASSGIGRALTLEAASEGYAVIAVAKDGGLEALAAQIANDGGACVAIKLNVTAEDAPDRIVEAALARFGRIDVIVHCAGEATGGVTLLEQNDAQIDGQWHVHVAAPLRITRRAFPLLKDSGGHVLFIGSGLRRVPAPYYGAYCAAKAAVETLSIQLRRELAGTGVAVTFVDPGSVNTSFARTAGIPEYGPSWVHAQPEHVAKRIMKAVHKRPSRMLAVPWHTVGAILGEWFPSFADKKITPPIAAAVPATAIPEPSASISAPQPQTQTDFERALEPVVRRMERVKLPASFLEQLLSSGGEVQLADAAMRWAGMPNKNERAAMAEALDALETGGFLERTGEESWRVIPR